jgi:protein-L-isoaspartate(D-aspartate) O-methyltransferase
MNAAPREDRWRARAAELVEELRPAIADERVLQAIAAVPRERFVPRWLRSRAYDNTALPIGQGQTISQPLVVARMCEVLELKPDDRVLEVGTGSGYHAAVLCQLAGHVWSIERHAKLAHRARAVFADLGIENATLLIGDGSAGYPPAAPYDAISVTAAASGEVPPALIEQLAPGGRLVAPVADREQQLVLLRRTGHGYEQTRLEHVRFVPLVAGE